MALSHRDAPARRRASATTTTTATVTPRTAAADEARSWNPSDARPGRPAWRRLLPAADTVAAFAALAAALAVFADFAATF